VLIRKGLFRSFDENGPFPVRNEEESPEKTRITAPIGDPGASKVRENPRRVPLWETSGDHLSGCGVNRFIGAMD
jgi:hypothetical protein